MASLNRRKTRLACAKADLEMMIPFFTPQGHGMSKDELEECNTIRNKYLIFFRDYLHKMSELSGLEKGIHQ